MIKKPKSLASVTKHGGMVLARLDATGSKLGQHSLKLIYVVAIHNPSLALLVPVAQDVQTQRNLSDRALQNSPTLNQQPLAIFTPLVFRFPRIPGGVLLDPLRK